MALSKESSTFLHLPVAAHLHPRHRNANKDGGDNEHTESDLACVVSKLNQVVKERIDRVAIGAEGECFLLRHGKN